jgi:tetratricopeptide (TPR) repeat protein
MSDEWSFRIPFDIRLKSKKVSAEEAEKMLLEKLKQGGPDSEEALWELAIFYSRTNRQSKAMDYIRQLMDRTDDPEEKGLYFLKMGQFMEQIQDYSSAITYYRQAFSLEPVNSEVWYYINNNLGYCLNYFGKYQEGERYCQAAIKIDPQKHNAYKNLGISLEGQGQYSEAAKLYVAAIRTNAVDDRALGHLENLLAKHNEVSLQIPDIDEQLQNCRNAVRIAKDITNKFNRESDKEE